MQPQSRPRASAPRPPMVPILPMLPQQLEYELPSLQEATTCHTEHAAHTPAQLTAERALRACGGAWAGAARAHLKASRSMPTCSAWMDYDLGVLREQREHLPRAGGGHCSGLEAGGVPRRSAQHACSLAHLQPARTRPPVLHSWRLRCPRHLVSSHGRRAAVKATCIRLQPSATAGVRDGMRTGVHGVGLGGNGIAGSSTPPAATPSSSAWMLCTWVGRIQRHHSGRARMPPWTSVRGRTIKRRPYGCEDRLRVNNILTR